MRNRGWRLALGLAVAMLVMLVPSELSAGVDGPRRAATAALVALMALWWLTEALPLAATACLPLVVLPLARVYAPAIEDNVAPAAAPYFDAYIFLFMGGMCIAAAMQQCGLHRRVALAILLAIGTSPRRLLAGVLAGTAALSMWISNTATAALMVPIGMAVIAQTESRAGTRLVRYGASLMLAVAWGANLGGIGTKIGTAPNAQFAQFMAERGVEIGFLRFLALGAPFVVLMLPLAWLVLWLAGRGDAPRDSAGREAILAERAALGPMRRSERVVLAVFLATAVAWIFGRPLTNWLREVLPGRAPTSAEVEGGVAMLAAVTLMLVRSGGRSTLEWRSLRLVPWSALVLLGGAFALADGVQASGLSAWFGERLAGVRDLGPFGQTLAAAAATVTLSAFASNTATIAVMLGVLAGVAAPENATTVLAAATIASSCDFALPAGTPPNAIVFGSGYVTVARMACCGAVLDAAAALVAAAWCTLAVPALL